MSDVRWSLTTSIPLSRTGRQGPAVLKYRTIVEATIYHYESGIAWRELPEVFGPWQTVWTWHRRMAANGISMPRCRS
jgi:putative transposase